MNFTRELLGKIFPSAVALLCMYVCILFNVCYIHTPCVSVQFMNTFTKCQYIFFIAGYFYNAIEILLYYTQCGVLLIEYLFTNIQQNYLYRNCMLLNELLHTTLHHTTARYSTLHHTTSHCATTNYTVHKITRLQHAVTHLQHAVTRLQHAVTRLQHAVTRHFINIKY